MLPTGTVTFVFTDMEASTRRWESDPGAPRTVERLERIVRATLEEHGGHVFATMGDGFAVAFQRASAAVVAAGAVQGAVAVEQWDGVRPAVRIGVHTGEAVERDGNYFGPSVNRTARIMAAGHGGQVLLSAVTARVAGAVAVRDLGEHQLRDLDGAERIFQLLIDGQRDEFPPLRTEHRTPTNLPTPVTSFVGRDGELQLLTKRLGASRLITLVGTGGAGKTRLAIAAASDVLEMFSDGVWFAGLIDVRDQDLVPSTVARAMGRHDPLVEQGGPTAVRDQLATAVGSARCLLVLDNCEHLVGAAADLVTHLLASCPHLVVLATSRELLGIAGEQLHEVGSLDLPTTDDLDAVMNSPAAALFADRAAAVLPTFEVTAGNASSVAALCRRLDGLPLALELAAARARLLSPGQLLDRLDRALDAFGVAAGDQVPHHRTLHAALRWSYDLLEQAEMTLFRQLAVFRGSFTLEAAEAVGGDTAIDALDGLVNRSMVAALDVEDSRRFRLLDVVRQFASELLIAAGGADGARERHRDHYRAVIYASMSPGSSRQRALVHDLDNVRSAIEFSMDRRQIGPALGLIVEYPCWLELGLLREKGVAASCSTGRRGESARRSGIAVLWTF